MQMIRSVLNAGEPTALIQREVLILSDDERSSKNETLLLFQVAQIIRDLSGWGGENAPDFLPNCG